MLLRCFHLDRTSISIICNILQHEIEILGIAENSYRDINNIKFVFMNFGYLIKLAAHVRSEDLTRSKLSRFILQV